MLLKSQRNQLIYLLDKVGINLGQYRISEDEKCCAISVTDDTSNSYYFQIRTGSSHFHYHVYVRPGSERITDDAYSNEWSAIINHFVTWVQLVRREIDLPDVWAELQQTAQLFAPTAEPSDDKFTRTELAEVQGQLRLLQLSFAQAALPEAAKQKLIGLTQTAAVKAEGFTKKDWQSWFIGALIGHVTEAVLNSGQIHEVYKLVKAAFGGLFLH